MTKQKTKFKQNKIGTIPKGWEVKELKDVASYVTEKINLDKINIDSFISTEDMLSNKKGVTIAPSFPKVEKVTKFKEMDILLSNIRTYFKKLWLAKFSGGCSNDVLVIRPNSSINKEYLYYFLSQDKFFEFTVLTSKGTKMPRGDKEAIMSYKINLPPLPEQRAIAKILSDLDTKIESNMKQVGILEKIGLLLFKEKVLQLDEYKESSLDQIANYLNGLALQKYPPKGKNDLPVIKIRELKQGITDTTDLASSDIPKEYIVNDGDILFSWSGSLEVVIWCDGKGALNQHLFKVTSDKYPKWFYYYWTLHHLKQFKRIAEDKATTMGHIKRKHLSEAKVLIPTKEKLEELNKIFNPIIEKQIMLKVQVRTLARIRDLLLPKLMTGKIRVPL